VNIEVDTNMRVATVDQHGVVRVYGRMHEGVRALEYTKGGFANRGQALYFAACFEDDERRDMIKRMK
jgi:hypothetical protein